MAVSLLPELALLVLAHVLFVLAQKRREKRLMDDLKSAGSDPRVVSKVMDRHIEMERQREAEWRRQNPGGL